ncbi:hypothetical protein GLYMA_13G167300v4 [Glycine max]|uniref:DUF3119 family protein n=3 Tax=Glycine subgen. Soja TaxID=1462606 RepID=K7M082_SOYBN|nr:uncharacterized protein LOC114376512 isoform X1 [Glycine soja]KAH1101929.1 hypothetical protein GYH30_036463 [Glycine max]KRH20273.1 hypothetical protein GLYMA_13G167300v4 [Glycine max]RZB81422.1 hypothetical protein D0Y65_030927 [Glycine soja]
MDFVKHKQMASTLLSVHHFLPSQRREKIGCLSGVRTSFCGQVVCNSSFCGRQITRSHGNRLVVHSLLGRKVKSVKSRETVIPEPDYRIPIVLLGIAGGLVYTDNLVPAVPVGLLGLLLLFQTTRVRFVFDDEALEVKIGEQLQESGENVFVGGKNRWKYSTFVNWEFWWPNFPILVYFKESQTKPEGQIHFFPIIFNGKQLYDVMVERAGPSKTSGPKES